MERKPCKGIIWHNFGLSSGFSRCEGCESFVVESLSFREFFFLKCPILFNLESIENIKTKQNKQALKRMWLRNDKLCV